MSNLNGSAASYAGEHETPGEDGFSGVERLSVNFWEQALSVLPALALADNSNHKNADAANGRVSDTASEVFGEPPSFDKDNTGPESTLVRLLKNDAPLEQIITHINMHFDTQREANSSPTISPAVLDEAIELIIRDVGVEALPVVLDRQAALEYAIRNDEILEAYLRDLEEKRQRQLELDDQIRLAQARAIGGPSLAA